MRSLRVPLSQTFGAAAVLLAGVSGLLALNPTSAGPEIFELKFKLPPPAPLTPEEELATFKLAPGFHAELVAAEPLVNSPTALSWDEKGRMWVCEMSNYMHDVEGAGEKEGTSDIAILEDTKGTGRCDKRTVFAEGLILPRALMVVNGGALVGAPPNLWFMKDTKGTGHADVNELVDGHFGSAGGQPEHMVNSPTWCLDNWIYCANHTSRYRLKEGKFIADSAAVTGQWGLSQDDYGRRYYNYNSDFLRASYVPEAAYLRNPNAAGSAGSNVQIMKDQHCWPSHQTPGVNRGYEKGQLREDGTLATCTATCGAGIYRGGLFPAEFAGNAFIPEPAGNLVKRVIIEEQKGDLTAHNAYQEKEFMTSTDERFRPVNAYTGPDGALYIVDMYRGVIQHSGFLTHYLVANILDRKLEQPYDRGRIWRIVPDGVKPKRAPLPAVSAELVGQLANANGWVRDTAQRLLVERKDAAVAPALLKLATTGAPIIKIHALWTLDGMGAMNPSALTAALHDRDAQVRAAAVRMADRTMAPELAKMVNDPDPDVLSALAFALSPYPEAQPAVLELARKAGGSGLVRDGLLSGLRGRELEVLEALSSGPEAPAEMLAELTRAVVAEHRSARVQKLTEIMAGMPANSPELHAVLAAAGAQKKGVKPKLIYLEAEPPTLAKLLAAPDPKLQQLAKEFDARLAWPDKPGVPPPPIIKPLSPDEQKLYEGGKIVYQTLCAACHQPSGTGMAGLAPPLVDSNWVLGNPEALPRIVIYGLSGPLKVNNQSWDLEMPPLGAALSDEQVAGVLTYLRREWEHGASPIAPAKVAEIRHEHQDRTKAWGSEELTAYLKERKPAKN